MDTTRFYLIVLVALAVIAALAYHYLGVGPETVTAPTTPPPAPPATPPSP